MTKPVLYVVACLCLLAGFIAVWISMAHDVRAHYDESRIKTTARVIGRVKSSFSIRYQVGDQLYETPVFGGLLRFDYPRLGEDRTVLVSKTDPTDAVMDPPIGGWFFWSFDLIFTVLLFGFFVWMGLFLYSARRPSITR